VARDAHRARATERVGEAALDQLVVDELAHERRGNALPAAGEHALLDARRDLVGQRARHVGLGHERRDDARAAPRLEAAVHEHARRTATGGGVLARGAERRAHARVARAIQDVGLRDGRVAQLDERLLDQVLDLLDAGQVRGPAGRVRSAHASGP